MYSQNSNLVNCSKGSNDSVKFRSQVSSGSIHGCKGEKAVSWVPEPKPSPNGALHFKTYKYIFRHLFLGKSM